jgi:hypothetical protein
MITRKGYLSISIILLFIFSVGFLGGCGEDEESLSSGGYLPIKVGNWWKYIDPDYPEDEGTILITGTTQLKDGKSVLVAEADDDRGYLSQAANDMILFHEALDDLQGELAYRPPLEVGATWQSSSASVKVSAKEVVSTPAGIFQDCYRLDVRVVDEDNYYSVWLAKNVGPVKVAEIDSDDGEIEEVVVLRSYNTE